MKRRDFLKTIVVGAVGAVVPLPALPTIGKYEYYIGMHVSGIGSIFSEHPIDRRFYVGGHPVSNDHVQYCVKRGWLNNPQDSGQQP